MQLIKQCLAVLLKWQHPGGFGTNLTGKPLQALGGLFALDSRPTLAGIYALGSETFSPLIPSNVACTWNPRLHRHFTSCNHQHHTIHAWTIQMPMHSSLFGSGSGWMAIAWKARVKVSTLRRTFTIDHLV